MDAKISLANSNQAPDVAKINGSRSWHNIFWEARTRILAWYVILMACFILSSVWMIRQILFKRVEERVEGSLAQEVKEFRHLHDEGRNPATGQPFGKDTVALFEVFLSRNIPDDDEFLLTFVNGQFYKSSPKALPAPLKPDSELSKRWANLAEPQQGRTETAEGTLLYYVEPIKSKGKLEGVFVVTHLTGGEQGEVHEAIVVVIQVTLAVTAVASILAWVAAGRVLAPLRLVMETARSISETDLTRRIPVRGSGEVAELTTTFNDMLDRLQAAFISQRNFINDAGHELRTPITIVRGHLELLGDDPDEQQETLELVMDELDRMSRFVDDLILLAKAERLDFLQPETLAVGSFTEELLAKAQALANRDWQLDAVGSGRIVADRQRLTQAIMNLAQNATQHTSENDVIALGSTINQRYACFWVRDTGEGIAPEDQQQIFERFARLSNSRRRSEGAGLGLSIVRAIAQAHGGKVQLNSRLGAGSQFTIVIPLEPPQEVLAHESNSHR
ncbi:MAG: HAMP domain-containing histidine kinase [Coleofasciculus sp. S288]|nr:HAMP domain-containing histidine kinase [Coleofasciculus sp. S288]